MRDEERNLAISAIEDEIANDPERLSGMADWSVSYLGGGVYSRWLFTSPDMPGVRAIVETSPHGVYRTTFEGLADDAPDEDYVAALFARPEPDKSQAPSAPQDDGSAPPADEDGNRTPDPDNPWDETNYGNGEMLGGIAEAALALPHT